MNWNDSGVELLFYMGHPCLVVVCVYAHKYQTRAICHFVAF